ncbi:MAG: XRE family transcriptional regulator [Clostridia bacterium]|nr:XRE family transcriptional regulator [Clostridia bacterium]
MQKKNYEVGSYGAYLVSLIKEHDVSQVEFAKLINVSRTYLFDLFNGRVKPPAPEMQEKIISALGLSDSEKEEFYSKTAAGRNEIPKDIFDYFYNNADEIAIIRERMRA